MHLTVLLLLHMSVIKGYYIFESAQIIRDTS